MQALGSLEERINFCLKACPFHESQADGKTSSMRPRSGARRADASRRVHGLLRVGHRRNLLLNLLSRVMYTRSTRPPHRMPASPKRHRVHNSQEDALAGVVHHKKFAKTSSIEHSPNKRIWDQMLSRDDHDADDEVEEHQRGSHEQERFQSFQFPPRSSSSSRSPPPAPVAPERRMTRAMSSRRTASKSSQALQAACDMRVSKVPLVPAAELCYCGEPVEEDSMYCGTACARHDALRALNGDLDISSRTKEAERRAKEEKFKQAEEAIKAKQAAAKKVRDRERERAARLAKWRNVISKGRPAEAEHARNESSSTNASHAPTLSTSSSVGSYQTAETEVSSPDSDFAYASKIPLCPATPTLNGDFNKANASLDKTPSFLAASPCYNHEDILNSYLLRTPNAADASSDSTFLTPATRTAQALDNISFASPANTQSYAHDVQAAKASAARARPRPDSGSDYGEETDRFSDEGLHRVHDSLSSRPSTASSYSTQSRTSARGHVRGKLSFDDVVGILSS